MRMLTRMLAGWGLAALTGVVLGAPGCSNNGTTNAADLAVANPDLAVGSDGGSLLPDLAGPLADLTGSAVVRVNGGFAQPFGVFFDAASNAWYVSNVAGDLSNFQNLKDGRGWITKVSADYKTVDHNFFTTGLNSPSGLRIANGKIYVPDVDQLVVIDIAARTAVRSATVTPAIAFVPYVVMTDVTVDVAGVAYAPETVGNRILKFATPTVAGSSYSAYFPSGVSFPTTVYIDATKLVVGTTGNPMTSGSTGSLFTMNLADGTGVMKLGTFAANFQGLEKDGTSYLVGNTRGHALYQVAQVGGAQTLVRDFAAEGVASVEDFGWDAASRTLAVPDVGTNSVYFYKL